MIYFKMQNYETHEFSNVYGKKERIIVIDFIRGWFATKERIVSDKTEYGQLLNHETGVLYRGDYTPVLFKSFTCHIRYFHLFHSWWGKSIYSAKMAKM